MMWPAQVRCALSKVSNLMMNAYGNQTRYRGVTVEVLVDCAGGQTGGARRFRDELIAWHDRHPQAPLQFVGLGQRISARHLTSREIRSLRHHYHRNIATNNIGFIGVRGESWVLLRNALHFLTRAETAAVPQRFARRMQTQARMIKVAAKRADTIVVPTSEMAERVSTHLPAVAGRVIVAPHPVSPRRPRKVLPGLIVCPVLIGPYKRMDHHLELLERAVVELRASCSVDLDVRVTATERELTTLGRDSGTLRPIGRLSTEELDEQLSKAQAVYYPTTLESFGYPLAEARANGQPVVALNTARTREIAGPALVSYRAETSEAVADALRRAVEEPPPPRDPTPFCPDTYFKRWVCGVPGQRPQRP
jgi:glycosyltransferase involved in cell wall biosynthesis